ncbi:MAG: outer membrane protein assembly factor BamD, partial [Xanthomonadales bacterium]|nr:outer membrane protein assembly factor BamD [Xanthomonadales bacterium]
EDPLETMSVQELYQQAHQSLIDHDYSGAEFALQRLVARFPFGPYAEQAQLDLAYAQYKNGKPDDAYSGVNRFIKTYPAQKHIDYAYYLRGLINFDRSSGFVARIAHKDSSRRDPGFEQQSFEDFTQLVQRYPNSRYTPDARQRMVFLRNQLAKHELHIAKNYLRRQAYVGAVQRAKYIISHYQTSPETGDALAIMAKSYQALGRSKLAADALKVLKANYPQHAYLSDPQDWPHFHSLFYRIIPFTAQG